MRFSALSAIFTVVAVLSTGIANAHPDVEHDTLTARDLGLGASDALADLSARDVLSELSTRELLDELNDRLEARTAYTCRFCGQRFKSYALLLLHRKYHGK